MSTGKVTPLSDRFDARLLSLYSRGVQDRMPQGFHDAGQSYSFCYYDLIEVQQVKIGAGPVLKDAYLLSQKECCAKKQGLGSSRSLVAVMDIGAEDSSIGYTKRDIDTFWSQEQDFQLFFVSMLNLANTEDLESTLKAIKEYFRDIPHLAYITFDHCDIILFCRGDSFQEYARRIFKLYYASEKGLGDAITLYSFPDCQRPPKTEERFAALIRVGVKDYLARELFYKMLDKFEKENNYAALSKFWLLERNDIGFYREDATLSWLAQVRKAVLEAEEETESCGPWYTTYSLTVLIPDGTDTDQGWQNYDHSGEVKTAKKLLDRIDLLYKKFKENYEAAHARLREQNTLVYCDQVLLRWLEESYRLVVSLVSSRLSEDLGVCLLPQFTDMLTYSERLFCKPEDITRDDLEHIQESFGDFFSNIAVLVDSMNQTDRQFVQVPAFHLPSFKIPPQIMAFYTVIVRKMMETLRDNEEIYYGFTIAPKLVNTLSVFSLSIQVVPEKDEWISMNMDEMSFYTLRLATETIAHEVSHYIGEKLRKREVRKEYMVKCAFHLLVNELARRLAAEVDKLAEYAYQEKLGENKLQLYLADLDQAAGELWEQAQELDPEWYGAGTYHYSCQMKAVIQQIPRDIGKDWALAFFVNEQVMRVIEHSDEKGRDTLWERLRSYVRWKLGMKENQSGTLDMIAKDEARVILDSITSDLMDELNDLFANPPGPNTTGPTEKVWRQLDYLYDMFRETFADLQTILLLDMKWEDYCGLLLQGKEQPGADLAPRMFAVTKALLGCGAWKVDEISAGGAFDNVRATLALDPDKDAGSLAKKRISPALSVCLIGYLTDCARDIQAFFAGARHDKVKELQDIHNTLSDKSSCLELQKTILRLTEDYWRHLAE